jgi:uncharacterized membrane protein
VLVALFVGVVALVGRWRGVRALAGLAVSLAVVALFVLPSLLRANNAVAVAIVATVLVAFAALYLAHGVNTMTTVALFGTLASLLVIVALAATFVALCKLTGLADESAQLLRITASSVNPRSLLIAGTVIGALGVLDDVTVTQVSAVVELRHANPSLPPTDLYRRATRIGRDHIASTVNTLVLAYVGAALPLFLFFAEAGQPVGRMLTREVVAAEVVRTLAGGIGLVLSVPLTTALAVYVLKGHHASEPPAEATPTWDEFAPLDS